MDNVLFVWFGLNGKYPDPLVLEYFQTIVPTFVVKLTSIAEIPIQTCCFFSLLTIAVNWGIGSTVIETGLVDTAGQAPLLTMAK